MVNLSTSQPEPAQKTSGTRPHVRVLDGVRGIAILMVLMIHLYPQAYLKDVGPSLVPILDRILLLGNYGVQLFFVLSGFLITGILLDTKGEKGYFAKFYMRRTLRIFPLYYGTLIVLLVILPHLIEFDAGAKAILHQQGYLWTYTMNRPGNWIWDGSNIFFLGHFWSLCVEEHFYLVWPAAIALFSRRRLFNICILLVLVGLLAARLTRFESTNHIILHWTTLRRVEGLAVGAMLAIAMREPQLGHFLLPGRRLKIYFTAPAPFTIFSIRCSSQTSPNQIGPCF